MAASLVPEVFREKNIMPGSKVLNTVGSCKEKGHVKTDYHIKRTRMRLKQKAVVSAHIPLSSRKTCTPGL